MILICDCDRLLYNQPRRLVRPEPTSTLARELNKVAFNPISSARVQNHFAGGRRRSDCRVLAHPGAFRLGGEGGYQASDIA